MSKTYLWQETDFPHFYYNPVVVEPLEAAFKQAVKRLDTMFGKTDLSFENVFTEEIVANQYTVHAFKTLYRPEKKSRAL